MRGSDAHSVIDINTGELLNRCSRLVIGDTVWCGNDVMILKSASIPSNTVIGGGSVVAKVFVEQNTVIAGNPARVIKQGIRWDLTNPAKWSKG